MTWRGDIGQVGRLAERIGELSRVPSRVAARVADELELELRDEYDAGRDPYGEPWEPLAPATEAHGRTAAPLAPGSMLDSLRVAPAGAGVGVAVAHPAEIHQNGWSGPRGSGPARRLVPDHGLPEKWPDIVTDAAEDEFQKAVRR